MRHPVLSAPETDPTILRIDLEWPDKHARRTLKGKRCIVQRAVRTSPRFILLPRMAAVRRVHDHRRRRWCLLAGQRGSPNSRGRPLALVTGRGTRTRARGLLGTRRRSGLYGSDLGDLARAQCAVENDHLVRIRVCSEVYDFVHDALTCSFLRFPFRDRSRRACVLVAESSLSSLGNKAH